MAIRYLGLVESGRTAVIDPGTSPSSIREVWILTSSEVSSSISSNEGMVGVEVAASDRGAYLLAREKLAAFYLAAKDFGLTLNPAANLEIQTMRRNAGLTGENLICAKPA